MTDTLLLRNRIPLGVFMLIASIFLAYIYSTGPIQEIIFLLIKYLPSILLLLIYEFVDSFYYIQSILYTIILDVGVLAGKMNASYGNMYVTISNYI